MSGVELIDYLESGFTLRRIGKDERIGGRDNLRGPFICHRAPPVPQRRPFVAFSTQIPVYMEGISISTPNLASLS